MSSLLWYCIYMTMRTTVCGSLVSGFLFVFQGFLVSVMLSSILSFFFPKQTPAVPYSLGR